MPAFLKTASPVSNILHVNEEQTIYIQEDFGDDSLLTILEKDGHSEHVYQLFMQSL